MPLGSPHSNRATAYEMPDDYTASTNGDNEVGSDSSGHDADGASVSLLTEAQSVRALVMHKDAVATVKLLDLSVESEYQIQRQGTLIVSKYAMGHNVLRPAMAVAITANVS